MPKLKAFTGEEILVDKDDFERFQGLYITLRNGHPITRGQNKDGKMTLSLLSKLVMNCKGKYPIKILNKNPLDLRKCNLALWEPKRHLRTEEVSSKWSALKQKLLCKSSGAVSS